ncbi:YwmB family TATA-box binding protein [Heyndrickxia vini]|uniref:YwmB family TATA-box binding protein n=1 Tax=Heyndrickxia vini TaxID=1476025 RepID=A0ABX7E0E0_9BACI|nr:YwmB family TATA-box binding protein [Heyndrickxia vini]QQZ09204.1 YwmB family TATA-box binding protein [Heyndrickxia vini]
MKKNILYLLTITIFFSLLCATIGNRTVLANFTTDLDTLINGIEHQHGKIAEWSLYTRESINVSSKSDWLNQVDLLKEQFPHLEWDVREEKGQWQAEGFSRKKNIVESIKLLSTPTNNQYTSYLIYEVKGTHWNSQIALNVNKSIGVKLDALYSKKPVIFSCIKGEFSDKMDKVLLSEVSQILTSLHADEKEALKEKDFISISAYSPKIMQSIPTKDNRMNLQIGLRKTGMGANTSFVIGTPIITIEY